MEVDEDAVEHLVRRAEVVVLFLHREQELVRPVHARHCARRDSSGKPSPHAEEEELQNWGGAPRRGTRGGGELGDEALAQDLEPVLGLLLQLAEERLRVVLAQPVDHVVGPFEGDAEPFLVLVVGLDLGVDLPHHVAQLVPALPPLGIGLGRLLPMSSRTTRHEEVRREDEQSK